MAGRPRKPTQQLIDKGAFEVNPARGAARANEPEANGPIGDPPDYFDQTHIAVWAEFVEEAPRGVLTKADRKELELAVRLLCKIRFEPGRMVGWLEMLAKALEAVGMEEDDLDEMKETFASALGASGAEIVAYHSCLQRMGLTPSDRSKVSVAPAKKESRFAGLASTLGTTVRPN